MSVSFDQLSARAQTIRDEQMEGANTSLRVGALLADTIDTIRAAQESANDLGTRLGKVEKTTADQGTRLGKVEKSTADQGTRLGKVEKTTADLLTWSAEVVNDLSTLKDLQTTVRLEAKAKPLVHQMHWCEVLSWTDDTPDSEIRQYFEYFPGLWEELWAAASGVNNRGICALGDDSYRRLVPGGSGMSQYEEVEATTWGTVRMQPISTSENVGGQSLLLGYEATGSDGLRHVWRVDLFHSKDDKVYRARRWEVTQAGSGSGGGNVPQDVEARLQALEGLLRM